MIPRKLRVCRGSGRTKGQQDGLHRLAYVSQPTTVGKFHDLLFLIGKWAIKTVEPLCLHNGTQLLASVDQLVIDQNVVVFVILLDFAGGRGETALDHVG